MTGTPKGTARDHDRLRQAVVVVALAAAYYVSARIGLQFASVGDAVTPVWPPTGIAVFALFTFGRRAWPGVFAGAFLIELSLFSPAGGLAVAAGNTLAVIVAASILRRRGFDPSFSRVTDTISLIVAAGIGMLVSASIGAVTLVADGSLPVIELPHAWLTWWAGDGIGVLIVAPVLWAVRLVPRSRSARIELAVTLIATTAILLVAYSTTMPGSTVVRLLPLWALWRFGLAGGAPALLIAIMVGVVGVARGWTVIAGETLDEAMIRMQAVSLTASVAMLLITSLRTQHFHDRSLMMEANEALEHRVRERTRELAEAQHVARIGSFDWDLSNGTVTWSDEMFALVGADPATTEPSLEAYLDSVHPGDREETRQRFTDALRTGVATSSDHRLVARDGRRGWMHAEARIAPAADGSIARIYGTAQDVTERKTAEQTLQAAVLREHEAATQQRDLASLRERILSSVSHELRTPLTVVIGMASTLRRPEILRETEMAHDLLARLEAQAKRLERMLADLLDLDRLQHGSIELRRVPIDVHALARHVADRIDPAGHTILVNDSSCIADADASKVERVIEHLVGNALRHTPLGATIWITASQRPGATILTVEDDGPGVPDADKAKIFDVFWQKSGTPSSPGAGVGLTLVARIAKAHGGRAWVTDRPGGGSAFHVEFPEAAAPRNAAAS